MKRAIVLTALGGFFALAQSSKEVWVLGNKEVNSTLAAIRAADPKKPSVSKIVGTFQGHLVMLIQRNGDGEVEVHQHKHDIMFIREGSATLVTGGEVVNGKSTGEGEIRGPSVKGGTKRAISAGDIVQVPATVPHQLLLKPGQTIAYATVKVDAP